MVDRGIVIGSDKAAEWMIPWWWENYRRQNDYPVMVVDFGMSERAKEYCRSIGGLVSLDSLPDFMMAKESIPEQIRTFWVKTFLMTKFWTVRKEWFKKPFALLCTPFAETLWLDLDCEVRGSLKPLFDLAMQSHGLSLVKEPTRSAGRWKKHGVIPADSTLYNTGVIGYRHGSAIICDWAEGALSRNNFFAGDQDLLCQVIYEKGHKVNSLPTIYNWRMRDGINSDAVIIHWVCDLGKRYIIDCIRLSSSSNTPLFF